MRVSVRLSVLVVFLIAVSIARSTETYEFSRYQVILDRGPFGPITGGPGGPGSAPPFSARYTLVGIVNSNAALQAIIFDKEANRSYFRAEGESIDDVKVVRIEQTPAKLVIQKGLETATLTFEQKPNTPGTAIGATQPPQPGILPGAPSPGAPTPRRIPFRRGS